MATEKEIYISINGTKQAITSLEDLTKATEDLAKGFEDTGKAADKAAQEVEKVGGGSKIGNGFKRIGDLGKAAFNGIGVAIKATGIGLLVTIVAKLIEEFMKTDTAAKLLQGSMAVLGVIFEKIQEAINFLIEYGVKVFKDPQVAVEDFRAGVQALGDWFKSLGDYIKNNFILLLQNMQKKILEARIAWNEFTGDNEEAESLQNRLTDLNAEIEVTKENIADAAEEVAEPFVKAAQFIAGVVTEIVNESKAAIAASNAAIDAANAFAALQNRLLVENAKLTKQLEEQKKIAEDTTRSYEERKAALELVNEANEKLVANALLEAKANENLISQQLSITKNDEDRRALQAQLAAATAERIAREQEASIVQLESAQLLRELDKEELDRKKSINDLLEGLRVENILDEEEAAREALRIAEETALAELELLKGTEEEKQRLRDAFAVKRDQLEADLDAKRKKRADDEAKEQKERDEAIQEAKFALALNTLNALSALADAFAGESEQDAKRNFKIQKALSLATATVSGTQAVLNAYASAKSPTNPLAGVPGYAALQAGLAAVFAAAQIATIAKSKYGGSTPPSAGGGGGGGGSAPQFDPSAALRAGNEELAGLQNAGGSIRPGGTDQQPIRAYVIATEVTNAQQANAQIENLATL
jgi:hypothetical protein